MYTAGMLFSVTATEPPNSAVGPADAVCPRAACSFGDGVSIVTGLNMVANRGVLTAAAQLGGLESAVTGRPAQICVCSELYN